MTRISAGEYSLVLDPERGGSVVSFCWQGHDIMRAAKGESVLDTACFPLVPFSNRIAEGRFRAEGREIVLAPNMPGARHPHPLHGFGWLSPWRVLMQDGAMAVLEHDHPAGEWPWTYKALQSFTLTEEGLTMELSVTNLGATPMPAGLGFHPYFPAPGDAVYRGLHRGEWRNSDDCIPQELEEKPAPADWWNGAAVGTRAVDTVYTGRSGDIGISWPGRGFALDIVPSANLGFTVVFTPEGKDYFCIEPVTHMTDAVNSGRADSGITWLAPTETMRVEMTLRARAL